MENENLPPNATIKNPADLQRNAAVLQVLLFVFFIYFIIIIIIIIIFLSIYNYLHQFPVHI